MIQSEIPNDSKFYLIGATRGPDDEKLVDDLRSYAKKLGIYDSIEFLLN
jgi:hypothetical protein